MSNDDFARRARAGSGLAARKRDEVTRCWGKISSALGEGSSLRSIHRELQQDGHDVGCFTHFRNNVQARRGAASLPAQANSLGSTTKFNTVSKQPQPFLGDERFEGY